jgi:hypothetical protein
MHPISHVSGKAALQGRLFRFRGLLCCGWLLQSSKSLVFFAPIEQSSTHTLAPPSGSVIYLLPGQGNYHCLRMSP